ncbi:MAG: 7-carboxy-7-deazaguanine synthase QueE [Pseudomonadota bacterium]|jgi:7-carboxy-7-deazaguanine synthase
MTDQSLRITEVFYSLQGEALAAGLPTVFIRLTGCPLRCVYCDSEYAFFGGERMSFDELLAQVATYNPRYVCVTGGEPLAQPNCLPLLRLLCDRGYQVSLETSGALDISGVDERVSVVMDLKTPGSGELSKNRLDNIPLLKPKDQIKFVITDYADFQWASFTTAQYQLADMVGAVWFSPSFGQVNPVHLAEWILRDRLPVRFQLQLHKQLWGEVPGV